MLEAGSARRPSSRFLRCQDEDVPGEQKKSWQVVRGSLCKVRRVRGQGRDPSMMPKRASTRRHSTLGCLLEELPLLDPPADQAQRGI